MNCPVHIIKDLSTLDNTFANELILEMSIETVHVLAVETDGIQILWQLFNVAY